MGYCPKFLLPEISLNFELLRLGITEGLDYDMRLILWSGCVCFKIQDNSNKNIYIPYMLKNGPGPLFV